MSAEAQTNAVERRRWNDEHWTSIWPRREQLTSAVTGILLEHLGLVPGQRVLDIGSGGGTTTMAAARLVGDRGSVVGADISAPLVDFARRRAQQQGVANVSFIVADVQQDTIPGAPFGAALSQFGVTFFDEPATAFSNIRRHLAAGGRLGFACWQARERNPWFVAPALDEYVESPPPPAPGKSPTGPFSFGDPELVSAILTESGFSGVRRSQYERVVTVGREAIIDDEHLAFMGVSEESLEDARQAVDRHLQPLARSGGRIAAPLAFQLFTAIA